MFHTLVYHNVERIVHPSYVQNIKAALLGLALSRWLAQIPGYP